MPWSTLIVHAAHGVAHVFPMILRAIERIVP